MIHSHSFFLSLLPAKKLIIADEENKGTSIFREVILISLSLSFALSQESRPCPTAYQDIVIKAIWIMVPLLSFLW